MRLSRFGLTNFFFFGRAPDRNYFWLVGYKVSDITIQFFKVARKAVRNKAQMNENMLQKKNPKQTTTTKNNKNTLWTLKPDKHFQVSSGILYFKQNWRQARLK